MNTARWNIPNPSYVLVLISSTLFLITCLAYLIVPTVLEQSSIGLDDRATKPGTLALAAWLDRNGPMALGVEFVVMLGAGVLAMIIDPWFQPRPARNSAGLESQAEPAPR